MDHSRIDAKNALPIDGVDQVTELAVLADKIGTNGEGIVGKSSRLHLQQQSFVRRSETSVFDLDEGEFLLKGFIQFPYLSVIQITSPGNLAFFFCAFDNVVQRRPAGRIRAQDKFRRAK